MHSDLRRILVSHLILFTAIAAGEWGLRTFYFAHAELPYPHGVAEFNRDSYGIGLTGPARVTVNRRGLRGDEVRAEAHHTLILGNSGALNWMLDDRETWAWELQNALSTPERSYQTLTAARPGNRMMESALQLEGLTREGFKIDTIVVAASGVELLVKFFQGSKYRESHLDNPADREEALPRAFAVRRAPFSWTHFAIVDWARERGEALAAVLVPPVDFFTKARAQRIAAAKIDDLPDLQGPLAELNRAQKEIARLAQTHGAKAVFLTWPTLWKTDASADEEKLFWLGHAGDHDKKFPGNEPVTSYYSTKALAQAAAELNRRLLTTCAEEKLTCFDLASAIPKTTEYFFDDTHFTPKGAAKAAEFLAESLK